MPVHRIAVAVLAVGLAWAARAEEQPAPHQTHKAPPGATVRIIWPKNGQVIKGGKFWLRMGLSGMGVAPAGVEWPDTGHHHVIIDADPPPLGEPIPNDRNHLHFGKGQTEARIELPPGRHTLQLMLGDEKHYPFDPPLVSDRITVIVKE
jgi:hypothetical protein